MIAVGPCLRPIPVLSHILGPLLSGLRFCSASSFHALFSNEVHQINTELLSVVRNEYEP